MRSSPTGRHHATFVFRRRLPKPTDPGDEKVLADIREYGFHAKHVRPDAHPEHAAENAALGPHPIYDIGFSYTVGLPYSHDHAEIALVGRIPDDKAHAILWEVVHLIEGGASFAPGDQSDLILRELPARFGPVSAHRRKELLTFADWAARRKRFEAVQLLVPDREGNFPGEAGYAGPPQPLLD
jgi:Domain of unknown function (DUF4262)